MAAGFSIDEKDLEKVRKLLIEDVKNASGLIITEKEPDFEFDVSDLSVKLAEELNEAIEVLKPYGSGFDPVRVRLCGTVRNIYAKRGKDGTEKHASFSLSGRTRDGLFTEVIWWNRIERARELFPEGFGDAAFTGRLEINTYNGNTRLQLIADDVRRL